jgi:NADH-quinone oxidoreductase subunit H
MDTSLIATIAAALRAWLTHLFGAWGVPSIFVDILAWGVGAIAVLALALLMALILIWLERKVAGYIQARLGPMRVGPIGLFQTAMDALKLLQKEDIIPRGADYWLHLLGPIIVFTAFVLGFAVIPWDAKANMAAYVDLNVGLIYVLGVTSVGVLGLIMAGWASNNKWSLLGAMRGAAQLISYEVPLLLGLVCVVMVAGSLSLGKIVEAQGAGILAWYIWKPYLWLPFMLFIICGTAEVNRTPFDLAEAESELVAGYNTEYSGMKFALFFLTEWDHMWFVGILGATLFLGGWHSPLGPNDPIPGFLWLIGKSFVIVLLMQWFRWTLPRLRVDQLMTVAWKFLVPVSILALAIVCVAVLFIPPAAAVAPH